MKKEVKHRDTLNQRQRLLTRELIKTNGDMKQAGLNAGYKESYVKSDLCRIQENPVFKQDYERKFLQVLKKKKIDDDKLATILAEGLNAEKVFTFQGQVIKPDKPVPDHFIRERFIQDVLKVRGDFAPEQHEHSLKRETAEEAFRQRIQKRQELESKANGGVIEKPVDVSAEVVDEDSKEVENTSEVTHKKDDFNEAT